MADKHRHLFDDADEDGRRVCSICGFSYRGRPVLGPADPEQAREETCKWYYRSAPVNDGSRMGFPEPVESYKGGGFKAWAPIPASQQEVAMPESYFRALREYEAARAASYESALDAHNARLGDALVMVPEGEQVMPYKKDLPKYHQIVQWLHDDRVLYAEPFSLQQFCDRHQIDQKPASQAFFILVRSGLLEARQGKGRKRIYTLAKKNGQWSVPKGVQGYIDAASAYGRERKQIQRERKQEQQRREEAQLAKQRADAEKPFQQRIAELEERERSLEAKLKKQAAEKGTAVGQAFAEGAEAGLRSNGPVRMPSEVPGSPGTPEKVRCQIPGPVGETYSVVLQRHQAIGLRDWLLKLYPLDPPEPKEPEVPTFHVGG